MSKNIAVLVIDFQFDFMDLPGAALPVAGAVEDVKRVCNFIEDTNPSTIFTSLDSHHALDISHPQWWVDKSGSHVKPFTQITYDEIQSGIYSSRIDPIRSSAYVKALEDQGEFPHFIWPEHCLIGSQGHTLHPDFMETLKNWEGKNLKWVNFIRKGENPYTEHFGIFRANIPLPEDSNTNINQGIFSALAKHETVYLAGEARSHCVANSLRQLLQIAPELAKKLIVIENAMSDVPGLPSTFYDSVNTIYEDAYKMGVKKINI